MNTSKQLPEPSAGATSELADRVLVLSDQPVLVEAVTHALDHIPVAVRQARDVSEASTALASPQPQLALVDMSLDDGQILEQVARARGPNARLPVLALIERGELQGWLSAVDRGADDILPIPFAAEEVVARVLALLRRAYGRSVTYTSIIEVAGLEIDVLRRRVRLDGVDLQLTSVEQPAVPTGGQCGPRADTRPDLERRVGPQLCDEQQHRRSAHLQPAKEAGGPLATAAAHRDGTRPGISLPTERPAPAGPDT